MLSRPRLTVVTHQQWRRDDLAPHADVRLDLGMDTAAAGDQSAVLWCPGAWAAAAIARHPNLRLSSAGPRWLDRLPLAVTGREIATGPVRHLREILAVAEVDQVFAKLPETKRDSFPAEVRQITDLYDDLARLPVEEPVQVQSPVHFDYEVRCWISGGAVVASAAYFPDIARESWPDHENPAQSAEAAAWLNTVIAAGTVEVPPAVVVDVGWCTDPVSGPDGWRIVEANAAWSADWYAPDDMPAVIDTIAASQRGVSDRWLWRPSPALVNWSTALSRR